MIINCGVIAKHLQQRENRDSPICTYVFATELMIARSKKQFQPGPNNGPMFTRITAASQNAVDAALKFRNSLASQKRATPLLP
jgi:hypothetical protein